MAYSQAISLKRIADALEKMMASQTIELEECKVIVHSETEKRRELELAESKYRDQVAERKAAMERELASAKSSGGITAETLEKLGIAEEVERYEVFRIRDEKRKKKEGGK
jgi:hypothetical protein